jgi:hypothetical protein
MPGGVGRCDVVSHFLLAKNSTLAGGEKACKQHATLCLDEGSEANQALEATPSSAVHDNAASNSQSICSCIHTYIFGPCTLFEAGKRKKKKGQFAFLSLLA